jgi:hypothetical protein
MFFKTVKALGHFFFESSRLFYTFLYIFVLYRFHCNNCYKGANLVLAMTFWDFVSFSLSLSNLQYLQQLEAFPMTFPSKHQFCQIYPQSFECGSLKIVPLCLNKEPLQDIHSHMLAHYIMTILHFHIFHHFHKMK